MNQAARLLVPLAAIAVLSGCASTTEGGETPGATSETPAVSTAPAAPSAIPGPETSEPPSVVDGDPVAGTVVRFTGAGATVDVTIGEDNPTVRDFLSLLPTTVTVEEYAGAEKIAYLERELDTSGSPGFDPEDGDLIYYAPWGNLGFYYDASGIGFSEQTIQIGQYDADLDELTALEGADVSIAIVPD